MTVGELIKQLQKYPEELPVIGFEGGEPDLVIVNPDDTITVICEGGTK